MGKGRQIEDGAEIKNNHYPLIFTNIGSTINRLGINRDAETSGVLRRKKKRKEKKNKKSKNSTEYTQGGGRSRAVV
jgi:hypothetical protein